METVDLSGRPKEASNNDTSAAHDASSIVNSGHQYAATSFSENSTNHLGDVIHNHYQYTGQPVALVRSSCRIPFRRDRDFVKPPIFDEIYQCALQPAARVGVVGLGGIGKTQLAIEYGYRRRDADPQLWVFWAHASSAARFQQSYRQIAEQIHISGLTDPKADVLSMVYNWLSDESNGRWTMVLDNADDCDVVFGVKSRATENAERSPTTTENMLSNKRSIVDCLPSCEHGSIVITSRSREVVQGLIEYAEDIFDLKPMSEVDAGELLKRKMKKSQLDDNPDATNRLVCQLDYMPLAITQAAAYINQPGSHMTVIKYSERLTSSDRDRDRLLATDIRDPRRDGNASNSIIITWHTSFERIRRTRASAARLLSLMSLFDREGIPKTLLQGQYSSIGQSDADALSGDIRTKIEDFEDDIRVLYAYQLVSANSSEELFEMHRLVQYSTKKWLELHDEAMHWHQRFIDVLGHAFPSSGYHDQPIYTYTLRNVHVLATVLQDQGNYNEAEKLSRRALKGLEKQLGSTNPDTLVAMADLARTLQLQGNFRDAEDLNQRVLAHQEKEIGPNHPHTLATVHNLALTLRDQGKYIEAEESSRRTLLGLEKQLGPDHLVVLLSLSVLASILNDQDKYSEANEIERLVLTEREKQLGPTHPSTLTTMNNLSVSLGNQAKYEEAEVLIRRALTGREKELGLAHPSTLESMTNLATLLQHQGKFREAENLHKLALAGRQKELGSKHPATLRTIYCLACLYHSKQAFDKALCLYDKALNGFVSVMGLSHPITQACQRNRDSLLKDMKKRAP